MKKCIQIMASCLLVIGLIGCGGNAVNEYSDEKGSEMTQETAAESSVFEEKHELNSAELDDIEAVDYTPDEVKECYDNCLAAAGRIDMPTAVGDITSYKISDDSNQMGYSFYIMSGAQIAYNYVGEDIFSVELKLDKKMEKKSIKDAIAFAVMVFEEGDFDWAKEIVEPMINSYSKDAQSDVLFLDKYKYVILRENSAYATYAMAIINPEREHEAFDFADYPTRDSEYFLAEFNKGECASVSGVVITDEAAQYYNTLEIEAADGIYSIYYSPEKFAGCFSMGKKYSFYGTIAAAKNGTAGCLRIDYYSCEDE